MVGGTESFRGPSSGTQEKRVYVGNLAYDVKWQQLKDFMKQAGDVVHADVLLTPNGRSKGCGIVEYSTAEEAQRAVESLSNQSLNGRLVFVREDRETGFKANGGAGGAGPGGYSGGGGSFGSSAGGGAPGTQLFVSNLPYSVGWQDLKDLFRNAGNVVRADVQQMSNGRSRGIGTVSFDSVESAQKAIQQYNGYELQGRPLEVREDRYARGSGGGGFSGGFRAAGPGAAVTAAPNPFTDGAKGQGDPSNVIYVGNLPWSTTNDDLVELFSTIGPVEKAEIQYLPNGRPAGSGVVEFDSVDNAQTAISKLSGYNYGGRDLSISFVNYTQ